MFVLLLTKTKVYKFRAEEHCMYYENVKEWWKIAKEADAYNEFSRY